MLKQLSVPAPGPTLSIHVSALYKAMLTQSYSQGFLRGMGDLEFEWLILELLSSDLQCAEHCDQRVTKYHRHHRPSANR